MKKAVFGLIGTGAIAQSQHLPNLARAGRCRLKTVCDVREDVLERIREKYRVPIAETDHSRVLADPEIQAVMIATKEDMQAKLTIEALRAGKHVYVEKPLANTVEECEAVVAAQQESGKLVALGFNRRLAPAYVKAREAVWNDGGPKNIHYRISARYWWWGPPREHVIKEACHILDIIRWFTGSEAESVYAIESRADDEIFTIKMKSGCVVSITSSNYVSFDMTKERVEIFTDQGGVTVEEFTELRTFGYPDYDHVYTFAGHSHPDREFTHKYLLKETGAAGLYGLRRAGWEVEQQVGERTNPAENPELAEEIRFQRQTRPSAYMVDKGWRPALEHFADCVLTGKELQCAGAADGLAASVLGHALIESRESGDVVRL